MKSTRTIIAAAGLGLGLALASGLRADALSGPGLDALNQRVSALEARLAGLNPVTTTGAAFQGGAAFSYANPLRGIGFSNADGTYGIQFSGTLQEDARNYLYTGLNSSKGVTSQSQLVDEFVDARARLLVDGYLGPRVHLRYQEDFSSNGSNSGVTGATGAAGGDGAILVDAYGELKLLPWTLLRVGQFKAPLDIERWRLTPASDFIQYGYTAGLVIDRTQGALIEIVDPKQVLYLSGGAVDGSTDVGSTPVVQAYNSNKDAVAKLFVQPFNAVKGNALGDLGLGVAGTAGNHTGAPEVGYKSLGQESIVVPTNSADTLTTSVEGAGYRVVPQAYWFWDNVSLLGEYVHESDNYRLSDAQQQNKIAVSEAWQAQAAWVITGEHTSYNGVKLNLDSHAWGALELVARVQGAEYDEDAVTDYQSGSSTSVASLGLLDPRVSVTALKSWSVGLNYIPVDDVEFLVDWDQTSFTNGGVNNSVGAGGKVIGSVLANRPTEQALTARVQFAF